jgi:hypothetical protein
LVCRMECVLRHFHYSKGKSMKNLTIKKRLNIWNLFSRIYRFEFNVYAEPSENIRKTETASGWKFKLGDVSNGQEQNVDDSRRTLNLPHDWK